MKRLVLELDDDVHAKVRIKASKERKTMREILTKLLNKWLEGK